MRTYTLAALSLVVYLLSGISTVLALDEDHDDVDDAVDRCPNTRLLKKLPENYKYGAAVDPERLKPGLRSYPVDQYGCEYDDDADGIVNSLDYCPDDSKEAISMGVAANGCPRQSDADGTPDYRDRCPNTPRGVKTDRYGCASKGAGGENE